MNALLKQSKFILLLLGFITLSSWTIADDEVCLIVEETPKSIEGVWKDNEYGGTIEITKTGDICEGIIVDHESKKHIIGEKTLRNLRYDKKDKKWKGKVYSPDRDKEYNIEVHLKEQNKLELIVSVGFLWKTLEWTRK